VPIGLNYLPGKDDRNYFEVGGGITIVSISEEVLSSDESNFTSTFGNAYFGYRLQPKNGGFLFRAGITPIFTKMVLYHTGLVFF
jgi:hypothetical protein